jgi:hypothetical protein
VFIGLDDEQREPLRAHFVKNDVRVDRRDWGRPTLVARDPDGNELFFWLPNDDFTGFLPALETAGPALRSPSVSTTDDPTVVRELEERVADATERNDAAALAPYLAPDFTFGNADGRPC